MQSLQTSVWIIAPYPADSIFSSFSAALDTMNALRLMPRRFAPRSIRSRNSGAIRIIVGFLLGSRSFAVGCCPAPEMNASASRSPPAIGLRLGFFRLRNCGPSRIGKSHVTQCEADTRAVIGTGARTCLHMGTSTKPI